jgi:Tfp pilus assembly protein PilE
MLRIALILALVASIASIAISFVVVKPRVEELRSTLATTTSERDTARANETKAKGEAKAATAAAEKANKELLQTKSDLETSQNEATMQHTRADKLSTELSKTTKDKNEAQEKLAQWEVLGIQPDQIRKLQSDLKETLAKKEELAIIKKGNERAIAQLEARLARYEGDDKPVEMPGLKGSVVAVDPKWEFVILDVGSNQGAKERGLLIVRRGDKLVGKVKLVTVEENKSVANILGDWKQGDVAVAPGDAVFY